ncbi:MAG: hypothetical protein EOP34_04175 [Rickettsiales bacterium]|nr:MAG: hypothetical protein EOP34_04175 [Rickettsiales bacterium]
MSTIDPQNPDDLDRTQDIVTSCKSAKELAKYFEDKENAINKGYRDASNTAAASGIPSSELQFWLDGKNKLIEGLHDQKRDAYHLGDYSDEESEGEIGEMATKNVTSESVTTESVSPDLGTQNSSSNAEVSGISADNPNSSVGISADNTNPSVGISADVPKSDSGFQDSSDIYQTDFGGHFDYTDE